MLESLFWRFQDATKTFPSRRLLPRYDFLYSHLYEVDHHYLSPIEAFALDEADVAWEYVATSGRLLFGD